MSFYPGIRDATAATVYPVCGFYGVTGPDPPRRRRCQRRRKTGNLHRPGGPGRPLLIVIYTRSQSLETYIVIIYTRDVCVYVSFPFSFGPGSSPAAGPTADVACEEEVAVRRARQIPEIRNSPEDAPSLPKHKTFGRNLLPLSGIIIIITAVTAHSSEPFVCAHSCWDWM